MVAFAEHVAAPSEERASLIEVTAVEQKERRVEILVEDADAKQMLIEKEVVAQGVREREDDWFLLLDVPVREPSFVAGTAHFPSRSSCFLVLFHVNYLTVRLHSV